MGKIRACTRCNFVGDESVFPRQGTRPKSHCKSCNNALSKAWRLANQERVRARKTAYDKSHRKENSERQKAWARKNVAKVRAMSAANHIKFGDKHRADNLAWRKKNSTRRKEVSKRWRLANKARIYSSNAARRIMEKRAMPTWIDQDAMVAIYERAALLTEITGVIHHIDHIVPIKSEIVCGLHVPANLQAIPKLDNIRKHNKYWPDMPETPAKETMILWKKSTEGGQS